MRLPDTEVVRAAPGHLAEALAALRADPSVVYAEPNVPVHAFTADTYWGRAVGAPRTSASRWPFAAGFPASAGADISAPAAWAIGATGAGQMVAIVDSGVNAAHPDLAGQIAASARRRRLGAGRRQRRRRERARQPCRRHRRRAPGAARDQRRRAGRPHPPAAGPRRGRVRLDGDIADAYDYAGDNDVGIVNASLGGPDISAAESDAFDQHPETLYVVAAGNGGEDGIGDDNDVTPT